MRGGAGNAEMPKRSYLLRNSCLQSPEYRLSAGSNPILRGGQSDIVKIH
jgi:hypothetical protein